MPFAENLGTGGGTLDAQYGSAPAVNANAPLLLDHDGTNYAYLPGLTGNSLSVPDSAALDITGDLDVRVLVMLDDWDTGAEQTLIAKFTNLSVNRSWQFRIGTTGALQLVTSADGTTILTHTSSVVPTLLSGTAYWLRATIDVASGANRVVEFFQAPFSITTPTVWTQIGTTITTAGNTSIFNSAAPLTLGCINAGLSVFGAGKFYRGQVLSGILGTVACDINCMTGIQHGSQTSFFESSVNSGIVTINRATSLRKTVAVVADTWLLGDNDYFEVPDSALIDMGAGQDFTALVIQRPWATQGASDTLVAKVDTTTVTAQGWAVSNPVAGDALRSSGRIGDGSSGVEAVGAPRLVGRKQAVVLVRSGGTLTAWTGGTAGTPVAATTGDLSNSAVMRIGRLSGAGAEYVDAEMEAVAVWRRALTTAEITALLAYYAEPAPPLPTVVVTGATTTTSGAYTIQSWTTSGSIAVAGGTLDIEYLVVAGGGAGGNAAAHGGGGAGGLLTNVGGSALTLTAATHAITVGAGGVAGTPGTSGSNSSLAALVVATGGGRGGYSSGVRAGAAGGSGGGGLGYFSGAGGLGTAGQGNNGGAGAGTLGPAYGSGGGGGAGAAGSNGTNSIGGAGGNGVANTITGASVAYGGGGGGERDNAGTLAAGGSGGGGTGGQRIPSIAATAGTDGFGGGGGGGTTGGDGGDGIVIVRYLTASVA